MIVLFGIIVILVYMKGWNEKGSELFQWIQKNRLVQWFCEKDISTQYCIVFAILACVIIWNIVNIRFNSFEINDTSARYLLSALVQSLAAIIAIIVTLTLVAVQLTASAYSPRVIDIFKENKILWWLLVWYGLSIFYGLFVLGMIGGKYSISNSWCIIVSLEICVFIAYLMGIVAFTGLFWHVGNVLNLLKLKSILKRLSEYMTKENVSKHIKSVEDRERDPTQPIEEDPGQPIMDIIHSSIMKYDIAATREGLDAARGQVIKIIDLNSEKEISRYFCDHFKRVSILAVRKMDEESTGEVIRNLCIFGVFTAEKGFENAVCRVVKSLGRVWRTAAESGLEDATREVAESLGMIGYYTVRSEEKQICIRETRRIIKSLTSIGEVAAERGFECTILQAAQFLVYIGTDATQIDRLENSVLLEDIVLQAAQSLVKLTNLSKYVKEVIECPKPTLLKYEQEYDRQSFMKVYERELEKSRTKVSK